MADDWTKEWERRVVNGVYPLRRYLGRSGHSVVFLTECKAQNVAEAAIKILPANPARMEAQLAHWRRVATLSHPHLMRLLDAGRCQLGGHNFLFVVTDHAEQNLGQILPGRALAPEEVRELLPPTLDALAYLHGKNLAQGSLKPPNFLVVGDQLKLACDTIRPPDERTASTARLSVYDPPEAKKGRVSAPGDIWALGITLIEALTQTAPTWSRESTDTVFLPANLPLEFRDIIQRCLNREPARRPVIAELAAQFKPALPETPAPPAPPPPMNEPLVRTLATQNSPRTRFIITTITVAILTLWVIWLGARLFSTHGQVQSPAVAATPSPPGGSAAVPAVPAAPRTAAPTPGAAGAPGAAASPGAVIHQELPDVSRRARESIRGIIKVGVRVSVDRAGNVIAAALDTRGSSKYFARTAVDAARKWRFVEGADPAARVWLLTFEFSRAGVNAHAAPSR